MGGGALGISMGSTLCLQPGESLSEGSAAGGARFSARWPCQACSHLVSHTKLHVGSKAPISPQEDTTAQSE